MGTRSLTVIQQNDGKEIAVLYRQFDGYPDGHGQELVDFLKGFTVVNGISGYDRPKKVANGMPCLAAQLIAHFKVFQGEPEPYRHVSEGEGMVRMTVGGFYLHPAGTRNCGEEFVYTVSLEPFTDDTDRRVGRLRLKITTNKETTVLYDGAVDDFSLDKVLQETDE